MTGLRWSIAFVTMDRPTAAQRFVRSARQRFPEVPIYAADQSADPGPMLEFYETERVRVVRMPVDAGLSASRNALVDAMDVDYFALCDDDFVLGPATSFESAIGVLEADAGLGVVGGMLHDLDDAGERIRNWEMFFDLDDRHGRFTAVPIYYYRPHVRRAAGHTLYTCDAVLNFAVFRMAMFSDGLRWDGQIKINGEHEDFYLAVKERARFEVAYLPSMAALHQPVHPHGRYATLRTRSNGRQVFMQKWGVTSHVEIGTGARPLDGTPAEEWFTGGHDVETTTFLRLPAERAATQPLAGTDGRRALDTVLEPGAAATDAGTQQYLSFMAWSRVEPARVSMPAGQLLFRYQPAVDPEGELLLWHRAIDARTVRARGAAHAGIVLRWFSPAGDALVWDSDVHAIDAAEDRYWQALATRIPIWPQGAQHLRFEVVCAADRREPLAMGFIFADENAVGPEGAEGLAVLAWNRTTPAESGLVLPREPLETLLTRAPRAAGRIVRRGAGPWGTLDVSTRNVLGIASNTAKAPPLWLAVGARRVGHGPAELALPLSLAEDSSIVLFTDRTGDATNPLLVLDPQVADPETVRR